MIVMKEKNTEIRLEVDGEIEYSDLKPLFRTLEQMVNFDFIIKISKIRLTNASYDFFGKPVTQINLKPRDKGEYDDNNYFPSEKESEHLANQLKQIDENVNEQNSEKQTQDWNKYLGNEKTIKAD